MTQSSKSIDTTKPASFFDFTNDKQECIEHDLSQKSNKSLVEKERSELKRDENNHNTSQIDRMRVTKSYSKNEHYDSKEHSAQGKELRVERRRVGRLVVEPLESMSKSEKLEQQRTRKMSFDNESSRQMSSYGERRASYSNQTVDQHQSDTSKTKLIDQRIPPRNDIKVDKTRERNTTDKHNVVEGDNTVTQRIRIVRVPKNRYTEPSQTVVNRALPPFIRTTHETKKQDFDIQKSNLQFKKDTDDKSNETSSPASTSATGYTKSCFFDDISCDAKGTRQRY